MDLSKLERSEATAARVYLRKRRKAWDHFYFLQDLKPGDYLCCKEGGIYKVEKITEDFDASPLDIVVTMRCVKTGLGHLFGFSIKAYETDFTEAMIRWHNRATGHGIKDSSIREFKISEEARLLYEST